MPAPQRKTSEIMDSISVMSPDVTATSWSYKSVMAEICKLRSADASEAYMVEGILRAKVGDEDGAIRAHENSLRLSPYDSIVIWNYVTTLSNFYRFREARDIASKILTLKDIEVNYIKGFVWLSLASLEMDDFYNNVKLLSKFKNYNSLSSFILETEEYANTIREFISKDHLLKKDLDRLYSHIVFVAKEFKPDIKGTFSEVFDFYGQEVLHLNYVVSNDHELAYEMNACLLDRVSEDQQVINWDSVIVKFFAKDYERPSEFYHVSNS